jgi:hypothetical protein
MKNFRAGKDIRDSSAIMKELRSKMIQYFNSSQTSVEVKNIIPTK